MLEKCKIVDTTDCNLDESVYVRNIRINTNYKIVNLSDVAKITSGNSAPQDSKSFNGGVYPFFRTSDVAMLHMCSNLTTSRDYLNKDAIKNMTLFRKGTILFPKSGASTFLNHRAMLGVEGYVSSHLAAIIPDTNQIEGLYLYYLLTTVDAQDLTTNQSYPSLKLSQISSIKIPLPSIEEQQAIVAEIEAIENENNKLKQQIENNKAVITARIAKIWGE